MKLIWLILFFLVCYALVFLGVYYGFSLIDDFTPENLLVFLLLIYVALFLIINIHEFGHFFFGKLLGYRLLMYQIGFLNFTYENGKMKFSFKKIKGFSGFCAMVPMKDTDMLDHKHVLFYSGGIIFNVATALVSLVALPFVSGIYVQGFIYIFSSLSILLGLINLMPFKTAGNQLTDGKFIIGIFKNDEHIRALLTLQNQTTKLAAGIRPKELSFDQEELAGFDDPSLLLMQYLQAMTQSNAQEPNRPNERIINLLDDVSSIALPAYYYEMITAGILFDQPEWVDTYYPLAEKTLKRDRDVNGERVKAYYAWYTENESQAKEHIEKARSVADKFPLQGQAKMELDLINRLERQMNLNLVEDQDMMIGVE